MLMGTGGLVIWVNLILMLGHKECGCGDGGNQISAKKSRILRPSSIGDSN